MVRACPMATELMTNCTLTIVPQSLLRVCVMCIRPLHECRSEKGKWNIRNLHGKQGFLFSRHLKRCLFLLDRASNADTYPNKWHVSATMSHHEDCNVGPVPSCSTECMWLVYVKECALSGLLSNRSQLAQHLVGLLFVVLLWWAYPPHSPIN